MTVRQKPAPGPDFWHALTHRHDTPGGEPTLPPPQQPLTARAWAFGGRDRPRFAENEV